MRQRGDGFITFGIIFILLSMGFLAGTYYPDFKTVVKNKLKEHVEPKIIEVPIIQEVIVLDSIMNQKLFDYSVTLLQENQVLKDSINILNNKQDSIK